MEYRRWRFRFVAQIGGRSMIAPTDSIDKKLDKLEFEEQ